MTEKRGRCVIDRRNLSTSTDETEQLRQELDEQEAERIKNLPRDELICQVDGESDSQQELIERLAQMVINERDWAAHYCRKMMDAELRVKALEPENELVRERWDDLVESDDVCVTCGLPLQQVAEVSPAEWAKACEAVDKGWV